MGGLKRQDAAIPGLGRLAVHNALAAAAVGLAAGLDAPAVVEGLGRGWSAPHRGARTPLPQTLTTRPRHAPTRSSGPAAALPRATRPV